MEDNAKPNKNKTCFVCGMRSSELEKEENILVIKVTPPKPDFHLIAK